MSSGGLWANVTYGNTQNTLSWLQVAEFSCTAS